MDPVEPGLACGSDTAHMSLFGYDPRALYRGRGAFESMGSGLDMSPGDIAFKCNFATIDPLTNIVTSRRADRRFDEEGPILCNALDGLTIPGYPQYQVKVKYATEHRCGVVVSGPGLTDAISGTDPLKDNLPLLLAEPTDDSAEAKNTAAVVNVLSDAIRSILKDHPINVKRQQNGRAIANIVLLRGCGSRLALQPFHEKHSMRGCIVAPTKIIAGLGMCAQMDVLNVPGTTGDYRTSFHKKAEAIAAALSDDAYEFGFLHVKAVDDTGHDKQIHLKVAYQQVVDTMVGQLLRLLWQAEERGVARFTVVVTGDHSTPVQYGDHSIEPVPFAVSHLRHVVDVLGGEVAVKNIPLGAIPHPSVDAVSLGEEHPQEVSENIDSPLTVLGDVLENGRNRTQNNNDKLGMKETRQKTENATPAAAEYDIVYCDNVKRYDELSAASGALGRFPGSEMMPLIKQFAGVTPVHLVAGE